MTDNTYNGWTNYETWQAALWLNECDLLGRLIEDDWKRVDGEDIESFIYEILDEYEPNSLTGDIINGWLSCVDMQEIANSFSEDLKEEA